MEGIQTRILTFVHIFDTIEDPPDSLDLFAMHMDDILDGRNAEIIQQFNDQFGRKMKITAYVIVYEEDPDTL